jgi:hypothetical protein
MPDTQPTSGSSEEAKAAERPPTSIKPVKKKIGEASGNLRRREAWYQRRTGEQPKRSAS